MFFGACATKPQGHKNESGVYILTNEEEPKEVPLHVQAAKDAKAIKEDPEHKYNQIVGAAKISSPENYKGKTYYLYGADHLNLENYYFDIPVVYNDSVKKWVDYFSKKGRGFFERYSARGGRYAPLLGKILEEKGLPRDLIFLAMAESGFQNNAKSWAKAVGTWQFMPYTGKKFGLKIDWYVDERRDPIKSTIAAANYLSMLYSMFGSWELAAAAYNAGEGKIGRAIRMYKTENFWKLRKNRYLKSETKEYVPKIMALAIIGKNLKSFGFDDIPFHDPLDFEEIDLPPNQDLYQIAEAIELDFEELQRYNPELRRWQTPLNVDSYKLRLPAGYREKYAACCAESAFEAVAFQQYNIRDKSISLSSIAKKFKLSPAVVAEINKVPQETTYKRGDTVLLPFRDSHSATSDMYADLYEKPRKRAVAAKGYKSRVKMAAERGTRIDNPSVYHTVQKGESLWVVAKKYNQSLDTIIASNMSILGNRQIRAGDKLVVR
jgi:membrane-bound lytic murein transglycosylase D